VDGRGKSAWRSDIAFCQSRRNKWWRKTCRRLARTNTEHNPGSIRTSSRGENILDQAGNRVGNTRTLFAEANAGGRAASALLSVAAMDYIFHVQNVVVVHHSFCGTTTYTPELLIREFHDQHHADISTLFDRESIAIMDYEKSLRYDVGLLRSSPAVPKNVKLYGFFFDINSGKLTEVVRDIPAVPAE
jgi:carbonic anhydrase